MSTVVHICASHTSMWLNEDDGCEAAIGGQVKPWRNPCRRVEAILTMKEERPMSTVRMVVDNPDRFSRWWMWKLRRFVKQVRCRECGDFIAIKHVTRHHWNSYHDFHKDC